MRFGHNGSFGKKHVKSGKFRSAAKTKKEKRERFLPFAFLPKIEICLLGIG